MVSNWSVLMVRVLQPFFKLSSLPRYKRPHPDRHQKEHICPGGELLLQEAGFQGQERTAKERGSQTFQAPRGNFSRCNNLCIANET
jgi:hypothetical protein